MIPPSHLAQWKTVSQMTVIIIILLYINLKSTLLPLGYNWSIFTTHSALRAFDVMVFITMLLSVVTGLDYLVKNAFVLKGVLK